MKTETHHPPLALRTGEAARTLSVSSSTLERLRRQGLIPSLKVGGTRLYLVEDLQAFLKANRESGKEGQ
jgi:excisionase family DNA binding protein